ncbi:MAG: tRNA (adenosine(37)-N6)-threonylcarbamoyltransferase complex ATPase subunit type 1 TsaE [Deltaproteobacteria bacterium]|nr:tRNA (adenosine(37)-N6)-threonylcarbamoyltransferase complex ATPase subunit type 1 TsaE [Deltaproteobacteria bacterium]
METQKAQLVLSSESPEQTLYWGKLLGMLLDGGDVVALIGELGAGKTILTQGIANGLGVGNDYYVTSPTFTIINEYKGRMPVYHLDFYRIESPLEIDNLGLEEYLPGEGVAIIEWAEKIEGFLPKEYLMIILGYADYNVRKVNMRGIGERYCNIVNKIEMEIYGKIDCETA